MKIMLIIPSLGFGGAETLVLNWLRYWLCAPDIREIVLVLYTERFLERLGELRQHPKLRLEIEASNTPWRMFRPRYFVHLWRLRRIIVKHAPDIIHSNLVADIDLALLYPFLPRNIRIVHTAHCPVEHENKGHYRRLLKRFYARRRVDLVAVSGVVRDSIASCYHRPAHLILNGALRPPRTERFDEVKVEIDRLATAEDGSKKYVFVAVGRVMYPKNYEMMAEVFQRLHREGKPVVLIVLGDLINDDNRKRYLPMKNEGIFFLDRRNNVGDYLRCCDFFCTTSLYEGLSIATTEAISLGTIPIITPASGLLESLDSSFSDLISPNFSADSYYKTVVKAMEMSDDTRAAASKRLIERYEEKFTMELCSRNYLDLFHKIMTS